MKTVIFDAEFNGLEPDKIYCLSFHSPEDGSYTLVDYDDMRRFFGAYDVYIGQNITLFDLVWLQKILKITISSDKKIIDTLSLSWYLWPQRSTHSLEDWGDELGVKKVEINDWVGLSLDDYCNRCATDVRINTLLWEKQLAYLLELYPNTKTLWKFLKYLHFKMDCVREQEEEKWKLDVVYCTEAIGKLEDLKAEKLEALRATMPRVPVISVKSPPKVFWKSDGGLSAHGTKWIELCKERGLPSDYKGDIEVVTGYDEPNPTSHPQIKDWLFSLGWSPSVYKEVKNKNTGKVKEVPQINNQFSGELNPCVQALFEKEPALEHLNNLFCINHRLGILRGFLRDAKSSVDVEDRGRNLGSSNDSRYLKASISGFTNTLRFKHAEIVNLPKVNKPYGEYARGSLIAPDDYILCGSDMASLESRLKEHYIQPLDSKYVESMSGDDFDAHLDIAVLGGLMTEDEAEFYKWYQKKH